MRIRNNPDPIEIARLAFECYCAFTNAPIPSRNISVYVDSSEKRKAEHKKILKDVGLDHVA